MDQFEKKEAIVYLIEQLIGDRTLDEMVADTGLNRNRLHRLRRGDFTRMPSEDVIRVLTDSKSNPQNNITFADFDSIINGGNKELDLNSYYSMANAKAIGTIVSELTKNGKHITIAQGDSGRRYDYMLLIDDQRYAIDIKVSDPRSESMVSDEMKLGAVANSALTDADVFVIATSSAALFKELQKLDFHVKSKVETWLLDLERCELIQRVELN